MAATPSRRHFPTMFRKWDRVYLDEAHRIRKSNAAEVLPNLEGNTVDPVKLELSSMDERGRTNAG